MIQKIIQIGHPSLLKKSEPFSLDEIKNTETKNLASNLIDTLNFYPSQAVGLASVQINVLKRMFVMQIPSETKKETIVLINPEVVESSSNESFVWEGCMSINSKDGKYFAPVKRAFTTTVDYFDLNGDKASISLDEFGSHVLLHEIDHLNGILFLKHVKNPKNIWTERNLDDFIAKWNKFPEIL